MVGVEVPTVNKDVTGGVDVPIATAPAKVDVAVAEFAIKFEAVESPDTYELPVTDNLEDGDVEPIPRFALGLIVSAAIVLVAEVSVVVPR